MTRHARAIGEPPPGMLPPVRIPMSPACDHARRDALTNRPPRPAKTTMLSPHELATLMLVRGAPDQIDMTRAELDTLLARRLIALEPHGDAARRPTLTPAGARLLEAAARVGGTRYDDARLVNPPAARLAD